MAQSVKLSVKCDRCEREEERTVEGDIAAIKARAGTPQFEARLIVGEKKHAFRFDDLCAPCALTVSKHLLEIGKKIEGKSPDRGGK